MSLLLLPVFTSCSFVSYAPLCVPLCFLCLLWSSVRRQRVFAVSFCGRLAVRKERFKKEYRHPALDERLTTRRLQGVRCVPMSWTLGPRTEGPWAHALRRKLGLPTVKALFARCSALKLSSTMVYLVPGLQEARNLVKARKLGVRTPTLYAVDTTRRTLTMERIPGTSMKDLLLSVTHSLRLQHTEHTQHLQQLQQHPQHQRDGRDQPHLQQQAGGAEGTPSLSSKGGAGSGSEGPNGPLWDLEAARGIPPLHPFAL